LARKRTKKKSSNGVWVGSAISGGIILLICLALFLKMRPGPADSASGSITEANLAKQTLKTDGLPDLGDAPDGDGSLSELMSVIGKTKNVLLTGGYPKEKAELSIEVVDALRGAAASSIPANAFDSKTPSKRFEPKEINSDFKALHTAIDLRTQVLIEDGQFDEAEGIALSHFNLGKQIYEKNVRLRIRQRGLGMMRKALSKISEINTERYKDGEVERDEMTAMNKELMPWFEAISAVENPWKSKLKTIDSIKPNTADLVKVANEDQDVTFRIFAARRLGYALYERGDQGNQKLIKDALTALQSDKDSEVAAAAKAGESIERSEYAELRK
jgi:hypothetical protein